MNKIDLVGFDRAVFDQISSSFSRFAGALGFKDIKAIPISARYGDNVSSRSKRTPWYSGPHLLEYLETVDVEDDRAGKPFRMPVQWVNRPNSDFRGFAGTIVSGSARAGDEIAVLPSGQTTKIKTIIGAGGDLDAAQARRFGHHHARRRNRRCARRYVCRAARPPAGRRPVRGPPGLDVERQAVARALLPDEDQ